MYENDCVAFYNNKKLNKYSQMRLVKKNVFILSLTAWIELTFCILGKQFMESDEKGLQEIVVAVLIRQYVSSAK